MAGARKCEQNRLACEATEEAGGGDFGSYLRRTYRRDLSREGFG